MADPVNPYADEKAWKAAARLGAASSGYNSALKKSLERKAMEAQAQRGILQSSQQYEEVTPAKLSMMPKVSDAHRAANDAAYTDQRKNNALGQGQQQGMADYLRAMAEGTGGPSAAQQQLQQQTAQGIQGMRATAMGNRLNPAAAMRQANQGAEQANLLAAQQSRVLGVQEQAGAEQMLGNYLATMRGQDLQTAGGFAGRASGYQSASQQGSEFYANQQMQRNLANADAENNALNRQQDMWTQQMNAIKADKLNREAMGWGAASSVGQAAGSLIGI